MGDTAIQADRQELRRFGVTTGAIVALLFGLLLPWLLNRPFPTWPWVVAGILAGAGLAMPATLGPVYRGWMKFGHVMGTVNTRILLAFTFYVVIFPLGLVMRVFHKDPMGRALDNHLTSYRVASKGHGKHNMENPF